MASNEMPMFLAFNTTDATRALTAFLSIVSKTANSTAGLCRLLCFGYARNGCFLLRWAAMLQQLQHSEEDAPQ